MKETHIGISLPRYDTEKSIKFDLISTFSPKHGASIGESLGSEAVAGHLQGECGDTVDVHHIDLQLDPDIDQLSKKIEENPPQILGISVKIGAQNQTEELVKRLNQIAFEPGRKPLVVMGGVLPTFATIALHQKYPGSIMAIKEGENAAAALVDVVKGDKRLDQVPGIWYVDDEGNLKINTSLRFDLSRRHLPARQTTTRIQDELHGMIWAEASRGCDFNCTFCSVRELHGGGFNGDVSPESVVADMQNLNRLGISSVSFTDDDFGGDIERTSKIAKLLKEARLNMQFSISTRADHIWNEGDGHSRNGRKDTQQLDIYNRRLLEIMTDLRDSGLVRVFIGMESGSPSQLKRYGKLVTVNGNYKAIEVLQGLGIDVVAGYIPIDPLMSIAELKENVEFLRRTGMYRKITNPLSVLRVQTGSPYLTLAQREGVVDEPTDDLVFYKAHFKDPSVQKIAGLADKWVQEIYPFIFGLKGEVATVTLGPGKNGTAQSRAVESTLFDFRELEMQLIETLTFAFIENPDFDPSSVLTKFESLRSELIKKTEIQARNGQYGESPRLLEVLLHVSSDYHE